MSSLIGLSKQQKLGYTMEKFGYLTSSSWLESKAEG